MTASGRGISIVSVFNDPDVRAECLDRSIKAYQGELEVDYIPIDNTTHVFTTAGAALNHGAREARHELVVFVHQDVYLHSIDRLAEAAEAFETGLWGVLGANGVTSQGLNVGRLRDRTQLIGVSARVPVEVETLDEVLFMVPRRRVLEHPLVEAVDLAWHAYAVEYSLRLRRMGLRAGAIDLAITHNSLTVNLARLDVAHQTIGDQFAELVPIHTTCGIVGRPSSWLRTNAVTRRHGWRLRWLRQSLLAARARRRIRTPTVFSDIRHDIDLLPLDLARPLQLINVDLTGGFVEYGSGPLELTRYGRPVVMRAVSSVDALEDLVAQLAPADLALIVGFGLDQLAEINWTSDAGRPWLLGIHPGEMWLLGGLKPSQLPAEWSRAESAPLKLGFARTEA